MTTPTDLNFVARGCDICGVDQPNPIHSQRFALFDDATGLPGYDVVSCRACGFVYADRIADQSVFDRYYREMSKYEAYAGDGAVSPWSTKIHRNIVTDLSARLPDRKTRILDVGCASGHLLASFKDEGYSELLGFDPSPRCAQLAMSNYRIEVLNTPISRMSFRSKGFDLILLSSVLEHLRDLRSTVRQLVSLLAPGGSIWAKVPDASRFTQYVRSPFYQFSQEHINFFSAASLQRLMNEEGLTATDTWSTICKINTMDDPALDALFTPGARVADSHFNSNDREDVIAYSRESRKLQDEMLDGIEPLTQNGPIAIWGTGSFTLQLMESKRFRNLHIAAFVDANRNYQGKSIAGIPVINPSEMLLRDEPILVVSHASQDEIAADIRNRYHMKNELLALNGARARI